MVLLVSPSFADGRAAFTNQKHLTQPKETYLLRRLTAYHLVYSIMQVLPSVIPLGLGLVVWETEFLCVNSVGTQSAAVHSIMGTALPSTSYRSVSGTTATPVTVR